MNKKEKYETPNQGWRYKTRYANESTRKIKEKKLKGDPADKKTFTSERVSDTNSLEDYKDGR